MALKLDAFFDQVWDIVREEAEKVLNLTWDGDGPAHSGFVEIILWRDMYFMHSSDYDPEGPFEELEEALKLDQFDVPSPNPEIVSKRLPIATLLKVALGVVEDDGIVTINGRGYNKEGIEETLAYDRHRRKPVLPRGQK